MSRLVRHPSLRSPLGAGTVKKNIMGCEKREHMESELGNVCELM